MNVATSAPRPMERQLSLIGVWACWAMPLLFAETLIQLRSMHRAVRAR